MTTTRTPRPLSTTKRFGSGIVWAMLFALLFLTLGGGTNAFASIVASAMTQAPDTNTTQGFSLSGRVTVAEGKGLANVNITIALLSSNATTAPVTLKTNAEGYYRTTLPNGRYGIAPKLEGYSFTPERREASIQNADVTGQDFRAQARDTSTTRRYNLSGRVTIAEGKGLANVNITIALLSSNATATPVLLKTNSEGYYRTTLPNGRYGIAPKLEGYSFTPERREASIQNADVTGQDFRAQARDTGTTRRYNLSGRVTVAEGKGLTGVNITIALLSSNATATPVLLKTNSEGYYKTTLPNGRYGIAPKLEGYSFTPERREVTIQNADVTGQDFRAQARDTSTALRSSIKGRVSYVTTTGTFKGLAGVAVKLSNGSSATTNSEGNYEITNVPKGSYTLQAVMTGYTFTPAKRDIKIENSDVTGQDFVGVRQNATTTELVTLSCYPNPASAQTTVRYTLPRTTSVTLGVYTRAGTQVATLLNAKEETAGTHEDVFVIPASLPSDVYMIVLKTAAATTSIMLKIER